MSYNTIPSCSLDPQDTIPSNWLIVFLLIPICSYDASDLDDLFRHLTNTARSAEDDSFDEAMHVKVSECE
jgi:hypothetical protein